MKERMRELATIRLMISRMTFWAALGVLCALGVRAQSTTSGLAFTVQIYGDPNVPTILILNESRVAITHVEMTIGNTGKNFDSANVVSYPSGGGSATLVSPDTGQDGLRNDSVVYKDITSFDPGDMFIFAADIDPDSSNGGED